MPEKPQDNDEKTLSRRDLLTGGWRRQADQEPDELSDEALMQAIERIPNARVDRRRFVEIGGVMVGTLAVLRILLGPSIAWAKGRKKGKGRGKKAPAAPAEPVPESTLDNIKAALEDLAASLKPDPNNREQDIIKWKEIEMKMVNEKKEKEEVEETLEADKQPPLWRCDDAKTIKGKGVKEEVQKPKLGNSPTHAVAKLLVGAVIFDHARARDRERVAENLRKLLAGYKKKNGKWEDFILTDNKLYKQMTAVQRMLDREEGKTSGREKSSFLEENVKRWDKIKQKAIALMNQVAGAVQFEKKAGKSLKRCAPPNPVIKSSEAKKVITPELNKTSFCTPKDKDDDKSAYKEECPFSKNPDYVSYSEDPNLNLGDIDLAFQPYMCGYKKDESFEIPVTSRPTLSYVKFLHEKVSEHMQVIFKRKGIYMILKLQGERSEGKAKKQRALANFHRQGSKFNDQAEKKWQKVFEDVVELEKMIQEAVDTELEMAHQLKRCLAYF